MKKIITFYFMTIITTTLTSSSSAFIITNKNNKLIKKISFIEKSQQQDINNLSRLNLFNDFITDNFFAVNGLITGMFLTAATGASRIVSANEGWEERLRRAKEEDDDDENENEEDLLFTELDIRSDIAKKSPSRYGPKAATTATTTDDINTEIEFESKYGITYDPYYDLPYEEDELPNDVNYSKDPFFGDRVYENGEQFFCVGKGLYYRKGSRPRMKFLWN